MRVLGPTGAPGAGNPATGGLRPKLVASRRKSVQSCGRDAASEWPNACSRVVRQARTNDGAAYIPALHATFGTFSFGRGRLDMASGLTPSVTPVFEIVKWMEQRGWMGELA